MGKMRVECDGKLLFMLADDGTIEIVRDGWLITVDVQSTLRTGKPVVAKTYVGKTRILTAVDKCGMLVSCSN